MSGFRKSGHKYTRIHHADTFHYRVQLYTVYACKCMHELTISLPTHAYIMHTKIIHLNITTKMVH